MGQMRNKIKFDGQPSACALTEYQNLFEFCSVVSEMKCVRLDSRYLSIMHSFCALLASVI
jgi:hypothetical protein